MATSIDDALEPPKGGVLVLAAYPPELAGLRGWLEARQRREGDMAVELSAVGIGLAEASVGAALAIERARPRAVVVVGTCGAYPSAAGVSERERHTVVIGRTRVVSTSALLGRGFTPEPIAIPIESSPTITSGLAATRGAGPIVEVATTLAVTSDADLANTIARETRCAAEHLETAGIALACRRLGVPWGGVLGVANDVGPEAHTQWAANHMQAGAAACAVVAAWIDRGLPGL